MFSKKNLLNYLPLILIILLASILRLYALGQVPISMSDDELRDTYHSYSIAKTGADYFGNPLPLVFGADGFNTYGPLPIYFSSLFFLFLPLNPFIARLPYVLASIGSVVVLFFVVKKILHNNKIALTSSFVLAVSVWHVQLGRFVMESGISLFVYLLAICLFLYSSKKLKSIFLAMVVFFLSFYGYSAHKLFFLPAIIALIWYRFKELSKKQLLIIISTVFLAFGSYVVLGVTQKALDYSGTPLFFLDKQRTALAIELERRASNEPNIIESLYHNKFTYWGKTFATNYLIAFSPQYLFLNQEASGIYSIWGRGVMYLFELPLLIIGFVALYIKKRKEFIFVLLLLLISPLPSALGVNTPTWMSRSELMVLWLSIFVGAGIYYLITMFKNKNYKYIVFTIISLFYLYGVVGYLSQYYFDWSRSNAKYFSKSTKDLVYKIENYKKEGKQVLVAGAAQNTFLHYAFYNKLDPKIVQENINKYPIKYVNFTFQKECLKTIPNDLIYIASVNCRYKTAPSLVIKTYDNVEVIWNIYER